MERAEARPVLPERFPDPERRGEADLASEHDRRRLDGDLDFLRDFDLGLFADPDDSERLLLEVECLFEGDRFFLEALPFREADRCFLFAVPDWLQVRRLRDMDGERRLPIERLLLERLLLERDLLFSGNFFFDGERRLDFERLAD